MKRFFAAVLAALMLAATAACGGPKTDDTGLTTVAPQTSAKTEAGKPAGENTVTIADDLATNGVGNLDTTKTTTNRIFQMSDAVFSHLMKKDPYTLALECDLLTKTPEISADSKVFTFELRQDAKFHDGTPVTSADVEYTFTRFFDPDTQNVNTWMCDFILGAKDMIDGKAETLAGFKVVDDYHFTIELAYGYTAFLQVLAVPPLNIVPKAACEAAGERWGIDTLIGSGPYRLESFNPQNEVVLARNDDYYGEKVKVDRVSIVNMDPNTALLEWEAGTIDACALGVDLVQGYLDNPEYADNVLSEQYVGTHIIVFNQSIAPLDNVKVRQALSLATDNAAIVDGYYRGLVGTAKTFIPDGITGYDASLPEMEYNPEQAKALLTEAGFPNGIEITASCVEGTWLPEAFQILQQSYKKANINLKIEKVDNATMLDRRKANSVQFWSTGWYADFLDPDNYLYSMFNSSVADFFSTGMKNKDFDAKLEAGRLLAPEEKQSYYADLEKWLIRDQFACQPLYTPKGYTLISDRVKNVFIKKDFLWCYTEAEVVQ